jgi:hypothetical protein
MEYRDISHGPFSSGETSCALVNRTVKDPDTGAPAASAACLHIWFPVWLAPFDFGINQSVDLEFFPAREEPGFLEIRVSLKRESGEANAWRRINRAFLKNLRKRVLMWRSLDAEGREYFEKELAAECGLENPAV